MKIINCFKFLVISVCLSSAFCNPDNILPRLIKDFPKVLANFQFSSFANDAYYSKDKSTKYTITQYKVDSSSTLKGTRYDYTDFMSQFIITTGLTVRLQIQYRINDDVNILTGYVTVKLKFKFI